MNRIRLRLGIMRLHLTLLALVIPDLSRFLTLSTLLRLFTPRRPIALYTGLGEQRIMALIDRRLRNPWRMRGRRCLRSGLLGFYLLRLAGIPARLHFGVYTTGGPRELAHCWVTARGRCLTTPPQDSYVPILTWGEWDDECPVAEPGGRKAEPPRRERREPMKLLFVGAHSQTMVSALRSLGRKGHRIDVAVSLSPGKFRIARWFASKYVRRQFPVPHPLVQAAEFRQRLLQLVRDGGYDAVFPFDQRTAARIAQWKNELERHTHVVSADWSVFELAHDKAKLHERLTAHGFMVPRMYAYESLEDLLRQDIRFPVVLKPRRSAGSLGLRYAANRLELSAAFREVSAFRSQCPEVEDYGRPLVQEYIPGKIHDGLFVCRHGEIRAAMTAVRSSTYPVTGGITVEAVTTHDPELTRYCRQILEFLRYHGPCDVEVKLDERDGTYKLLEINPRIWGALELSIRAGIDFVEKSCELAITGDTALQTDYRVGLKHWIPQRELMAIQQDKGNRWRRVLRLPQLFNRDIVNGIDLTDWKPELAQLVSTIRLFTKKRELLLPTGRSFTASECQQLAAGARSAALPTRNAA